MCGICGKLYFDPERPASLAEIRRMADTLVHRGPDDAGYHVDGPLALGFRRLSIIDLSTGHQPLPNEDETIWVVFNGEIYNYRELREQLIARGHTFRTRTDTEVLVHLYEDYGTGMLSHLRGMFGFALWDKRRRTLLLARDRVGIKPLYYSLSSSGIVFASEIKALLASNGFTCAIDPTLIDRFLSFYYMPGDRTLFKDVMKLPPGHYLCLREGRSELRQYWDLEFPATKQKVTEEQACEELTELLESTVAQHMISDVPVGVLLSGGVDSTAMLAMATAHSPTPLHSYTVGFSDPQVIDERPYARMAAQRYGAHHQELTLSSRQFTDFLPRYVWHMEEPVCEPPAVALYFVSQLARNDVTVLLSGEGGDEAFAGYSNYRNYVWFERLKRLLGRGQSAASLRQQRSTAAASGRMAKYISLLDVPLRSYYYSRTATPHHFFNREYSSLYAEPMLPLVDKRASLDPVLRLLRSQESSDLDAMLYVDTKSWLPDDLLIKADKMTMANSLELRVPLLDHRVLEYAAALPNHLKLRGLTTKFIARRSLRPFVPREILTRKKAGFPVPYERWLRTDMRTWVNDLLLDSSSLSRGYFDPAAIRRLLTLHQGSGILAKEVFSLAVLELWHRVFLSGNVSAGPAQTLTPQLAGVSLRAGDGEAVPACSASIES